jgi:hypothetical protein
MEALRVLLSDRDAEIRDIRAALGGRDAELEALRAEKDAGKWPSSSEGGDSACLRREIHDLRALVDRLQSGARDESRAMCLSDVAGFEGVGNSHVDGGDEGGQQRHGAESPNQEERKCGDMVGDSVVRVSRSERDAKAEAKRARVERGCMSALLER